MTSATFTVHASVGGAGGSFEVTGSGQADFAHDAGSATLSLPAPPSGGSPTPIQAELVGGTVYASVPFLASFFGGKPWISDALPAADGPAISSGFTQVATEVGDAASIVSVLQAHGASVHSLGSATVNGVAATGQEADVDVAKALAAVPGLPAGLKQGALGAIGASVPVRVWADAQGRLVELSSAVTLDLGRLGSHPVTVTVDVSGYGSPVTIGAPDPAQTAPLPAGALKGLSAGFGARHHGTGRPAGGPRTPALAHLGG